MKPYHQRTCLFFFFLGNPNKFSFNNLKANLLLAYIRLLHQGTCQAYLYDTIISCYVFLRFLTCITSSHVAPKSLKRIHKLIWHKYYQGLHLDELYVCHAHAWNCHAYSICTDLSKCHPTIVKTSSKVRKSCLLLAYACEEY